MSGASAASTVLLLVSPGAAASTQHGAAKPRAQVPGPDCEFLQSPQAHSSEHPGFCVSSSLHPFYRNGAPQRTPEERALQPQLYTPFPPPEALRLLSAVTPTQVSCALDKLVRDLGRQCLCQPFFTQRILSGTLMTWPIPFHRGARSPLYRRHISSPCMSRMSYREKTARKLKFSHVPQTLP